MSLTRVRKICQGIAFVGPAVCMVACALLTPATPSAPTNTTLLVGLLSVGFALGAWSRAGLYCNHQVGWGLFDHTCRPALAICRPPCPRQPACRLLG